MGFLDNFKEGWKKGVEAANATLEKQRAEKAAAAGTVHPQAQPRPQARPQQAGHHSLPEGVIMVSLNDMEPIGLGTNSKGQDVFMHISGTFLAKPSGQTSLDAEAQRADVKRIAREVLEIELTPRIESMGDLMYLMKCANNLNKTVCEGLKAQGYDAAVKIPLVIRPN